MARLIFSTLLGALGLVAASCQRPEEAQPAQQLTTAQVQERLIEQNRAALEQERGFIKEFMDSTGWAFQPAGSGAHEYRVEQGSGSAIQDKELVNIRYRLTGLRGDLYQEGEQEVRVRRQRQWAIAAAGQGCLGGFGECVGEESRAEDAGGFAGAARRAGEDRSGRGERIEQGEGRSQ